MSKQHFHTPWMWRPALLALMALGLGGAEGGCFGRDVPPAVTARAIFTVPSDINGPRSFLDMPWPNDADTEPDGRRGVHAFPNPMDASTLEVYREVNARGKGWALNGAFYLAFTAALDIAMFPDHAASMGSGAAMQLVDVDPASPERGSRVPLRFSFNTAETRFLPANTLTALPVLGFPLRPATTYALVITDALRAADGGLVAASDDLKALLSSSTPPDARLQRAHDAYRALRESASSAGIDLEHVVHATVITTADPMPSLVAGRNLVVENAPYPVANWTRPADFAAYPDFWLYEGTIDLPQFQKGTPPFDSYDGAAGGFVLDDNGAPIVQRIETVRFALTTPKNNPPPGGFPIIVMAHGTGGDFRSMLGRRFGDEAVWASAIGCAALLISQPLHNTREGFRSDGAVAYLTFNFLNPPAGTDNWRQSALESVALLHSIPNFTIPANVAFGGREVSFDAGHKMYFGHSQGGITGALMVGIEPDIDVAALSGAGGGFAESLLEKTEPLNIGNAVKLMLNLPEDEPLDEFHPVLTFMQNIAEVLEPLNAARMYFSDGRKAPNVLILSGLRDLHTPPRTHGPLAAAAGIPLLDPVGMEVEALTLRGIAAMPSPVELNLALSGDRHATSVLAQFDNDHFAVYENTAATTLTARFFLSYLQTGASQAAR